VWIIGCDFHPEWQQVCIFDAQNHGPKLEAVSMVGGTIIVHRIVIQRESSALTAKCQLQLMEEWS
jgi:hypothetical protein